MSQKTDEPIFFHKQFVHEIEAMLAAGDLSKAEQRIRHLSAHVVLPKAEVEKFLKQIAITRAKNSSRERARRQELEAEIKKRRREAARKNSVLFWIFLALAPASVFILNQFFVLPSYFEVVALIASGVAWLVPMGFFLASYLKPDKSLWSEINDLLRYFSIVRRRSDLQPKSVEATQESSNLSEEVERLKVRIQTLSEGKVAVSESDRRELVDELRTSVMNDASAAILDQIQSNVATAHEVRTSVLDLEGHFDALESRIYDEAMSVAKAARLNLVAGSLLTVVALTFLVYFVFGQSSETTVSAQVRDMALAWGASDAVKHFLPRIGLILAIEAFALFFLRLYKQSLAEAKYYQNELTNIQFRRLAMMMIASNEQASFNETAALVLLQTERNFVLKKGESTVELEKIRSSFILDKAVIEAGAQVLKNGVSTGRVQ